MDMALAYSPNPEQLQLDPHSAWDLAHKMGTGIIVDVRLPEEREWFPQVPEAIPLPLEYLQEFAGLDENPLDSGAGVLEPQERRMLLSLLMHHASSGSTLLCVCSRGDRSLAAALLLRALGYSRAYAISGGLRTWKETGLPLLDPSEAYDAAH